MRKEFTEEVLKFIQPAIDKGASIKIMPTKTFLVNVKVNFEGNSVQIIGNETFIKQTIASLAKGLLDYSQEPLKDNIIYIDPKKTRR